jgi:hypothetical protein
MDFHIFHDTKLIFYRSSHQSLASKFTNPPADQQFAGISLSRNPVTSADLLQKNCWMDEGIIFFL